MHFKAQKMMQTHTHTHTHTEMHPPVIYHEACFFFLVKMSPCAEMRLLKNPKPDQQKVFYRYYYHVVIGSMISTAACLRIGPRFKYR